MSFSPNGQWLVSGKDNATLTLWDVIEGSVIKTFTTHTGWIHKVNVSPNQFISVVGDYGTIELWEVFSDEESNPFKTPSSDHLRSASFSPDRTQIALGTEDGTITLWDINAGRELRSFKGHTDIMWYLIFSPDGTKLASSSADKAIKLWDAANGREIRTFTGHSDEVLALSFSPDGRILASGSKDQTIKLWDVGNGHELRTLRGHSKLGQESLFQP